MLLRKGVCPYEYMDQWEKFNEKLLPEKEEVYNNFIVEDIIDVHYMHAKRVCKDFEIKNLGELNFYQLNPAKFLSAPGLAWQVALKKT